MKIFIALCLCGLICGTSLADPCNTVGVEFKRDEADDPEEQVEVNDLHIIFRPGVTPTGVTKIPSPPAPANDVTWPTTQWSSSGVNFSGANMPMSGGTSQYAFHFDPPLDPEPSSLNEVIQSAYWTFDGQPVTDEVTCWMKMLFAD